MRIMKKKMNQKMKKKMLMNQKPNLEEEDLEEEVIKTDNQD